MILQTLLQKLKEKLRMKHGDRDVLQRVLGTSYAISPEMEKQINLWANMYTGNPPWLHEPDDEDNTNITVLNLPAMIAREKTRMALLEFESEITVPTEPTTVPNPDYSEEQNYAKDETGTKIPLPTMIPDKTIVVDKPVGDASRATYLNAQYAKLKEALPTQIEYGVALGGLVIKPYVVVRKTIDQDSQTESNDDIDIEFDYIRADSFYPLAFNASGIITEAVFVQTKAENNTTYYRLEYHKWENNKCTIINRAFRSTNTVRITGLENLGDEIPLTEVAEWSTLQPKVELNNVEKPLFAYFKMPGANTVDLTSPLGVSCFNPAIRQIKDADIQYSTLLWEYEAGQMAVNVDRDAFKYMSDPETGNGMSKLPKLQGRLYRQLDSEGLFEPFAPTLRDQNYLEGLNAILMRIEDNCSLSRGSLTDSADVARTATELKILKQRAYQANAELQSAIEKTLRDVIYIMNVYATLYEAAPEGEYEPSFEWDDSILVDIDEEINKRVSLYNIGLLSKVELRMWYFGETEAQATEALRKIAAEQQQDAIRTAVDSSHSFGNVND